MDGHNSSHRDGRSVLLPLKPITSLQPPLHQIPSYYKLKAVAFRCPSSAIGRTLGFSKSCRLARMATAEVADVAVVPAQQPVAESKPAKEKKPQAPKAPKEKKPKASKSSSAPSHPAYFQMIKDAILALNKKTGSSPYAIAKHMEEKHKGVLPANYKKVLAVQLRNFTAKGKLVKVKASFKLSETGKEEEKKKPAKEKKQPAKEAVSAPAKRKARAAAPKKSPKPTKANEPGVKKASPAKPKEPKSIRSPAAKRGRKAAA